MADRMEMARQFVREQIAKRDDIIAALVCGSVARGEDTDTSDIDLALYVKQDGGEGSRNLACWREGVYLEAGTVTMEGLGSLEEVKASPINATHMNDAVILFDPTGYFGNLQRQVRGVFMTPRWVHVRMDWALAYYARCLTGLREAVTSTDPFGTLLNAMWISHAAAAVPLYRAGVTPSSTRKLFLLAGVNPEVRARIIELECSLHMMAAEVSALIAVIERYCALTDRADLGGLPVYMIAKAASMMKHGHLPEAVDVLWSAAGLSIPADEARENARPLLQEWLRRVGWEGKAALAMKLRLAESLLRDVEKLAGEGEENVVTP
jgi:predicted nucleotidyltransferase